MAPVNVFSDRYLLTQPTIVYADVYERITRHLCSTGISSEDFEDRCEGLLASILRGELASLAAGVRVPFLLPRGAWDGIGAAMDDVFLPAVHRSWADRFPSADFTIARRVSGVVTVAPGSGHERLLRAMAGGSVVGWYFPLALSGFSVPAAQQQMAHLPLTCSLAGGYEVCSALVGCPDLLVKQDGYPPLLQLAALQSESPTYGYHFEAYGQNLIFNGRHHHGQASDYISPGLTVFVPTGKA